MTVDTETLETLASGRADRIEVFAHDADLRQAIERKKHPHDDDQQHKADEKSFAIGGCKHYLRNLSRSRLAKSDSPAGAGIGIHMMSSPPNTTEGSITSSNHSGIYHSILTAR